MTDRMRVPIVQTYRRSPFEGLLNHASKIKECLEAMQKGVELYVDGDYEGAERYFTQVVRLESEADRIKANTRNHLPRFIFMPVNRGDFLTLLREDDSVLDHAEDVAVLLRMRATEIPEGMRDEFKEFAARIVETGEAMEQVIEQLRNLLETSFSEPERKRAKDLIYNVHHHEYHCDRYQERLTRHLLNSGMDPISILHLMKVVEQMGEIADSAENAADRVRVMMGK